MAYYRLNDKDAARKALAAALEIDRTFENAQEAEATLKTLSSDG